MNPTTMTKEEAATILAQVLEHPGLALSFANHLIAREALKTLSGKEQECVPHLPIEGRV
jgi:hypothetical protein